MRNSLYMVSVLLFIISSCGPSPEDVQSAMNAIALGIESVPITSQHIGDGVFGNSSSFTIESEKGDIFIDGDVKLVKKNFQRTTINWSYANFKTLDFDYTVNGTINLKMNSTLDMSTYASKAVFDFFIDGGKVSKLHFEYKDNNNKAETAVFKVNNKNMSNLDQAAINQRLEKAFRVAFKN